MTHQLQHTSHHRQIKALFKNGFHHTHPPQLSLRQGKLNTHSSYQHFRNIEESMFSQAQEAFDILNEGTPLQVEGRSYVEIEESKQLREQLQRIRADAPIYQNWTQKQKQKYLEQLGYEYKSKLRQEQLQRQCVKNNETMVQSCENTQIQNGSVEKSSKKINKRIKTKSHYNKQLNKIAKPLFQLQKEVEKKSQNKRVSFFHESSVVYFSKTLPTQSVDNQRTFIFPTFDKF